MRNRFRELKETSPLQAAELGILARGGDSAATRKLAGMAAADFNEEDLPIGASLELHGLRVSAGHGDRDALRALAGLSAGYRL